MADLRDLITELANELDHYCQCLLDNRRVTHPLADKARAALAEPKSIEDRIAEADAATELSPSAQAVLDAFDNASDGQYVDCVWVVNEPTLALAAALCAAADQVAPECYNPPRGVQYPEKEAFIDGKCVRNEDIRYAILAIAAELKSLPD